MPNIFDKVFKYLENRVVMMTLETIPITISLNDHYIQMSERSQISIEKTHG